MAERTVKTATGDRIDFNILPLSPRIVTAVLDITYGKVTLNNTGSVLIVKPDPERVYLAFFVPNSGANCYFAPAGFDQTETFSLVTPGSFQRWSLKDDFLLVTGGWYGVSAIGGQDVTIVTQRRRL